MNHLRLSSETPATLWRWVVRTILAGSAWEPITAFRRKTRNSRNAVKGGKENGEWETGRLRKQYLTQSSRSWITADVSCVKTIQTQTDGSEINVSEKYRLVPLVREVREISS